MTEAVRKLLKAARMAADMLEATNCPHTQYLLLKRVAAVEAELSRTPQQLHEERIEEVLKWNR